MRERFDAAVVGAGLVGAAAAHGLAAAGRRVLVLDAGEPGQGTTANSFAWVNAVRKEPAAYHRLNADGVAAHEALAAAWGARAGYRSGGSLEWAEDPAASRELAERVERLDKRGYAAEWIDVDAARAMEPGLAIPPGVSRVAFFGRDGWVDAPRLARALLGAGGIEVRARTAVREFRVSGGRIEALVTDAGEVPADAVLLAVGPATASVVSSLGVALPVNRVPGVLALTSPPERPLTRVVHAPDIHLRPDPTGGLVLGADDLDTLVTETTPPAPAPPVAGALLERARAVFPGLAGAEVVAARIGVRPYPADRVTIAGRVPRLANAWVIATHSGVTLGPLLGRLIAAEMAGAAPDPRLADFRPDRF